MTPYDLISAMMTKPRTTLEIAERLNMTPQAVGNYLGVMLAQGQVRRAERLYGYQIWEAAQ